MLPSLKNTVIYRIPSHAHFILALHQLVNFVVQQEFEGGMETVDGPVDAHRYGGPSHALQQRRNATGAEVGGTRADQRTHVGHVGTVGGRRVPNA